MIDFLAQPVSVLVNVGPRYKALLAKLDIFTVEDLLYYIPFRYDDYSQLKNIGDLQEGETATVQAVMGPIVNIFTRSGKRLARATATDFSGKLGLIWFNQHYIQKILKPGATYSISGKVTLFAKKCTIVNPNLEEAQEGSVNTGRLVPIYFETAGLTSKWLRTRINDVLSKLAARGGIENLLPVKIQKQYQLKELAWALHKIHFPDSLEDISYARYKLEFDELFFDLLNVEKRKQEWGSKQKSCLFSPFKSAITKFTNGLPFELTDSQKTAVDEIIGDLITPHPMNRMLEGDVGTGKTVVAVIAAFLANLNGLKTIYLAPTEILAHQHFETFSKLLAGSNAKVSLLTASTKKIADDVTILIGTHALLYSKTPFEKVGLVVIDEQHRFGVEQRGTILDMSRDGKFVPNLLTMTATPIPRTLALTVYGDLSLSTLKTQPKNTRRVTTKIIPETHRAQIYDWVKQKNLATFIVCPFIEQSEVESLASVKAAETEFRQLSAGALKGCKTGLIHGRMKSGDKQKIIADFKSGKIKILIATPVIEVGIDVPDAAIIIIEGGERYGLASLHQLRGRVGRDGNKGFCFVFMSAHSTKAYTRLKNLENINDGMRLAEIDMRMRGQGDIFSAMQHGYKHFKIARLDDSVLLERAKKAAQEIFTDLAEFPDIEQKLITLSSPHVRNN